MARFLLILLSAALYAMPFPPWNQAWSSWVALLPFLSAIDGVAPTLSFWWGLLFGHLAHWAVAWWVPEAIAHYYRQPWWFALGFAELTSPLFWSGYYALFAAFASYTQPLSRVPRMIVLAAGWVTCEFARAHLLTGAPWLMLGYALAPQLRLVQVADFGGVYLLSFLSALVNVAIADALLDPKHAFGDYRRWLVPAAVILVVFVSSYAYGSWRLARELPTEPAASVAIVQGNNQDGAYWRPGQYGKGLDRYLDLSVQALEEHHPELLIWPEAAVTMFLDHEPRHQALIRDVLTRGGADLIVGAPHYVDTDPALPEFYNSVFYMTAAGITGRYDKVHLLPFVEYFPLKLDYVRRRFERVRSFVAGQDASLLETRLGPVAMAICFEAIFPDLVRRRVGAGAGALVVLSNDIWLGDGAGAQQHLAQVTLRAIENRVWVLRATTTGVSAVIDPYGRIVEQSQTFVPATLSASIVPLHIDTFYKRYGDVFAWGCVAASVAAILVVPRRRRSI
ncbi:MAG TPA: apolipoprotein N-acyltransferase [Candidatus Acidoferrales bacterium]|nr:apolipoprotein N-acyltransferase [Candidatus Acidoferrales bacterium]